MLHNTDLLAVRKSRWTRDDGDIIIIIIMNLDSSDYSECIATAKPLHWDAVILCTSESRNLADKLHERIVGSIPGCSVGYSIDIPATTTNERVEKLFKLTDTFIMDLGIMLASPQEDYWANLNELIYGVLDRHTLLFRTRTQRTTHIIVTKPPPNTVFQRYPMLPLGCFRSYCPWGDVHDQRVFVLAVFDRIIDSRVKRGLPTVAFANGQVSWRRPGPRMV